MKFFPTEVRIAIVAIIGIVVLFFGMKFLKGITLIGDNVTYYVAFNDVSGLSPSSPVYADGYKVGIVENIQYDFGREKTPLVAISINPQMRIPKGSSAEVITDFMGNVKVNLLMANNPRERVEAGDTIKGDQNTGTLGRLSNMMPQIEQMLPKLDSILTSLNSILADPAITQSLKNIQVITADMDISTKQLNALLASVNDEMPSMTTKINEVLCNTESFTANLAKVDIDSTINNVNATVANIQAFTDKLNSNTGSIGLLINTPDLYNKLNATVQDADSLVVNLKSHPKRYVHFSVFGRKDK